MPAANDQPADVARGRAQALAHRRQADPAIARLIDAHPDFDPRAWLRSLPEMDVFGVLTFQIAGVVNLLSPYLALSRPGPNQTRGSCAPETKQVPLAWQVRNPLIAKSR